MANKIHDAFDGIKAQPQLKESTKQFISEMYRKETRQARRRTFQRTLAAVCMALIFVSGTWGYSWFQAPVSYVSIDVNPSIELALNRFDRVAAMAAYNAEGEEILKSLSLKGKKYTEAIDLIVESKVMDNYLTDESEIVFTVAAADSREGEIRSGVESCLGHIGHNSHSISADIGIVAKAHGYGLSLGKYYAYLQLTQYDDTVTVDGCRDMTMSQIHGLVHDHEQEHEQGGEHCHDTEHGYLEESSVEDGDMASHTHQDGHHQEAGHE